MIGRLRTARREADYTQVRAARALGRPTSFISKCELGERRIDPVDLQEFARLYGKPIGYFLAPESMLPVLERGKKGRGWGKDEG